MISLSNVDVMIGALKMGVRFAFLKNICRGYVAI